MRKLSPSLMNDIRRRFTVQGTQVVKPLRVHLANNYQVYAVVASIAGGIYAFHRELKQSSDEQLKEIKILIKELRMEMNQSSDKLEMKFDGLSKEVKGSNNQINSRIDSVFLHFFDSPPKIPTVGE